MNDKPPLPTGARAAAFAIAAALLGACASAPVETFHTLRPAAAASPASTIAVAPVTLPALVDRPQWVLRDADGAVRILEQQRWAQPLAADLAQALGEDLAREIAAAGITTPALQLALRVERFDTLAAPAPAIADTYSWTLACTGAATPLRQGRWDSGVVPLAGAAAPAAPSTPPSPPFDAWRAAHAQALAGAARAVVRSLAEQPPRCP